MLIESLLASHRKVLIALLGGACLTNPAFAADPFGVLEAVPPVTGLATTPAPCPAADFTRPLDLPTVVDLALCRNPQTRFAWGTARLQAAQVGIARSAYLPNINATAGLARNHSESNTGHNDTTQRGLNASLNWVLFDFGARAATLESARQLFAAAAHTRDATVQSVFLAAIQAYFQRQAASAVLEAAQLSEKSASEALAAAEARYQIGSGTPADRLQARTAQAQAVLNRIGAEGTIKITQGTLANIIGADPTQPFTLAPLPTAAPGTDFGADITRLIDAARTHRPDLAAAEAQFRAAESNIDAARAAHLPTLSLGVNAGRNQIVGQPASNSSSLGLTLNIPIFSGFATTYRVQAAQAQAEQQAARRDQVRLQVALDVWNAYAHLTTATQSVKTAADLLESATQSERVAAGRYRAGVGNILDLLTAQAALASARQSRIQADTSWYISRAALAQSMGALDSSLLDNLPAAASAPAVVPDSKP